MGPHRASLKILTRLNDYGGECVERGVLIGFLLSVLFEVAWMKGSGRVEPKS